jgi:hypothetical protein
MLSEVEIKTKDKCFPDFEDRLVEGFFIVLKDKKTLEDFHVLSMLFESEIKIIDFIMNKEKEPDMSEDQFTYGYCKVCFHFADRDVKFIWK